MATCLDVQDGIDDHLYNPEECGQIGVVTKTTSDRCMCRDEITGETCEPLPLTNTLPCDVCELAGSDMAIGDLKKGIFTNGNIWGTGTLCGELASMQDYFQFSPMQCLAAQEATMEYCQCVGPDDQVNTCLPQEDSEYPCNPNDSETNCCTGSCMFRASEGEYVCSTKSPESVYASYVPWWAEATDPDTVEDQAPDAETFENPTPGPIFNTIPTTCNEGGEQCDADDDCCGSMQCQQGSQFLVCTGSGGKSGHVSAGGDGGGSGGMSMRRKLRKVGRSPGKFLRQQE
jgi:hypothetical protein